MFKNVVIALAGTALAATPVAAQSVDRAAAPMAQSDSQFAGSSLGWIFGLMIALGVGFLIIDDDSPKSP